MELNQSGTHLVGFELSFLEKLGWLLKEAKDKSMAGQLKATMTKETTHFAHGFGNTREQD